jgi:phosphoribosylamine--glycine ligase / phosphoribosylformylglycinamidine cyclo-ligase
VPPGPLNFFSHLLPGSLQIRCITFDTMSSSESLRILILGAGGREHALAWKIAKSPLVERIFVCPGNGGTGTLPKTQNVSLSGSNFQELVQFALKHEVCQIPVVNALPTDFVAFAIKVNLLVPGPEQPLVDGVEPFFRKGENHCSPSHIIV